MDVFPFYYGAEEQMFNVRILLLVFKCHTEHAPTTVVLNLQIHLLSTQFFNPKALIYYDINNPQPALERIQHLSENEAAYFETLQNEPIIMKGNQTACDYFSLSDDVRSQEWVLQKEDKDNDGSGKQN